MTKAGGSGSDPTLDDPEGGPGRADASGPRPLPPPQVGPYVIERELGRGGMGVVYLARDERLDRPVALKALPARVAQDANSLRQLETEARALASINDVNVATIHGIEEAQGTRWIVLEMVAGRSLKELLRDGALPQASALTLAVQVASGLKAAHERGIVHCDLKPANVRVTPAGVVKLVDFGLARSERGTSSRRPGRSPASRWRLSGTPGYMSPEQLRGEPVDARTDAWAFGCVLFEMLSGRPVFPGSDIAERIEATLRGEPEWTLLDAAGVPEPLQEIVRQCLAREPATRLDDLGRARSVLSSLLSPYGAAARPTAALRAEGNLPTGLSSFVGREREMSDIEALLPLGGRSSGARLVTLIGAGGCGKTRLALEIASRILPRLEGGAWIAELGAVTDPSLVPKVVAAALGVREGPEGALVDAIVERLESRPALLILDTCEHLIGACAELVHALLSACPGLLVLATSREPLGLSGEQAHRVPPMSVPAAREDGVTDVQRYEATRLFVERARLVRPGFVATPENAAAIAETCRRLDGIPLAIELAAARVSVLSIEQIVARLGDRFRLLSGRNKARVPRHETLQATIDWSHDLLTESERIAFRRLAVFAGTFTLEAAESVAGFAPLDALDVLDLVARLVDKSLVFVAGTSGDVRYRLLETIREYAGRLLVASGEDAIVRRRHRDVFVAFAADGQAPHQAPEHAAWLDGLAIEHDNLVSVLEWCASDPESLDDGYRLATRLRWLWQRQGYLTEGRRLVASLVASDPVGRITESRCHALNTAGFLARSQGDYTEAARLLELALAGFRELDVDSGVAICLSNLAGLAYLRGEPTVAKRLAEESLALRTKLGDQAGVAIDLQTLSLVALDEGDHVAARDFSLRSLAIRRDRGDAGGVSVVLANLAKIAFESGDHAGSLRLFAEAADILRRLGERSHLAQLLSNMGKAHESLGDVDAAITLQRESAVIARELGDPQALSYALGNIGLALVGCGDSMPARATLREAVAIRRAMNARLVAEIIEIVAAFALADGRSSDAVHLLGAAATIRRAEGAGASPTDEADNAPRLDAGRRALGDDAFESALAAGRALSREQALDLAAQVVEERS